MKYVLIFIVVSDAHFGAYSVTAEFDDKPACIAVMNELHHFEGVTFKVEPHNAQMFLSCEPKGSAK